MTKQRVLTGSQGYVRLVSVDNDENFIVYKSSTNMKVGELDAEDGKFRPTHTDETLSLGFLNDLVLSMEALKDEFDIA